MEIVQTQGLCKRYGDAMRVKELALSVPEGTVYGFLGPNGAGKSTFLRMLAGILKPDEGRTTIDAVSYTHLDVYKRQVIRLRVPMEYADEVRSMKRLKKEETRG